MLKNRLKKLLAILGLWYTIGCLSMHNHSQQHEMFYNKIKKSVGSLLPTINRAYAEELFFKNNGTKNPQLLNNEEYLQAYPLTIKYLFPMNTHPTCKDEHAKKLSQEEINEMLVDEHCFIQKQLKKLNPSLGAVFVPTILLEVFYVLSKTNKVFPNDINTIEADCSRGNEIIFSKDMESLLEASSNTPPEIDLENLTAKKEVVYGRTLRQKTIHDAFLEYVISKHPEVIKTKTKTASNKWFDEFHQSGTLMHAPDNKEEVFIEIEGKTAQTLLEEFKPHLGPFNYDLLKHAIQSEYSAHNNSEYLLYRSTYYDDSSINRDNTPHSLSFGNTLFAGINHDADACAGALSVGRKTYAVTINKQGYYNNQLANLFYIPPINTVIGLNGRGEMFHARTKTWHHENAKPSGVYWSYIINPIEYKKLIATTQPTMKFEQQLQNYLKKHKIVLKE